ncbi:MAG TPA: crotonase/enoyl-CoA hydratase family protein [Actinomycetota bacterium]
MDGVRVSKRGPVTVVIIDRPDVRNAVDGPAAAALADAFREFDADGDAAVGVLWGAGGTFCAGADLKAVSSGSERTNVITEDGDGPMGPSRMQLTKPVIAAVEGHAVAGGLELALWCDLRVAAGDAVFGVFNRRWGVPLIDGGTIRLPRIVGEGRALDLVLTGRPVEAGEAYEIGLVNRLCDPGEALDVAIALGKEIARSPQACLRADRASLLEQWSLSERDALANELRHGMDGLGDAVQGASRFASGSGRHGSFEDV